MIEVDLYQVCMGFYFVFLLGWILWLGLWDGWSQRLSSVDVERTVVSGWGALFRGVSNSCVYNWTLYEILNSL